MDHYLHGHFLAVARSEWKTKKHGDYETRDEETKGKVTFQIFHAGTKEDLISVGSLSLDVFPGQQSHSAQSISVPDYLAAVSGHMLCVVYLQEKNSRVLALYDMNEHTKAVTLHGSLVLDNAPTAIIAIKNRVFLGFPGRVGCVDLLEPKLSLGVFHEWQEQTWGREKDASFLKTIDAFAYDSKSVAKTLVAVDDVSWPKYAFSYDLIAKFDLPDGINEHYTYAAKHGDTLAITAKYSHRGGRGNRLVVMEGHEVVASVVEFNASDFNHVDVFTADKVATPFTAVGLLNDGQVVVLSARDRGVIAIPIKEIKEVMKQSFGSEYSVQWPTVVRSLKIGTLTQDLATVKRQAFAFVLSTEEASKNQSVVSQVVWNSDTNELQVVKSHHIEGLYGKLFVEV
eukprot:TRINITY_DN491_c0_g1_i2.p1 TRINITY_DN491_c0_g1~~TRINITY_DN491_c0_g1_i2.p1  ORF type:complete len:406 (-),score=116.78 TRINITY_DN491_c0_g1_i2:83-1276(-)